MDLRTHGLSGRDALSSVSDNSHKAVERMRVMQKYCVTVSQNVVSQKRDNLTSTTGERMHPLLPLKMTRGQGGVRFCRIVDRASVLSPVSRLICNQPCQSFGS
jgi:hypothetical protein